MTEQFRCWMPISKSNDGTFQGILSDNSIDRDGEFMTKELLETWANDSTSLPMLANHENKIEKLIGGWTNKTIIGNDEHSALMATPFFLESNPLGKQAKAMVEEALEKGLNIGISIGAIPQESVEKEIDGKKHRGFSKAEIVEATIVPIQSNRNSTFFSVAKKFDIDLNKESSEVTKMSEEQVPEVPKTAEDVVAEAVEAVTEEAPVVEEEKAVEEEEKPVEEEAPVEAEKEEVAPVETDAEKGLRDKIKQLEKQIEEFKTKVVGEIPKVETDKVVEVQKESGNLTIEKMLRLKLGGE